MEQTVVGVNEKGIHALLLEIDDYLEKIQMICNNLEDLANEVPHFLHTEGNISMQNHFDFFKESFRVMRDNFLSYKNDLQEVVNQYKKVSSQTAEMFYQAQTRIPK